MAVDKGKLEQFLNSLPLLLDEKRMWYRIGFYVEPTASSINSRTGARRIECVDAAGNHFYLSETVGLNIRRTSMDWWEGERTKPRAQEIKKDVPVTPYDELEVTRG